MTSTVYTQAFPVSGPTSAPNATTKAGGPHAVSTVSVKVGTGTPVAYNYKYDAAGNMTTRGAFANTWDNEGKLAATKNGTAAAGLNVYDADGNRLLRRNPDTSTTLYLDGTEITLGTSTVTPKTSQRWYQFAGKTIATRTSAGLTMLATDHHGTGEAQLDSTTNNYMRRKFTPFGGARAGSIVVGGVTWRGDHGFLEKPVDASSALSQIGARFYDSDLGTFISVDPLLDTADTHQANAYVYSKNSPMSNSDPTGMNNVGDWRSPPSKGNSGAGGSGTQTTTTTTSATSTTNSSTTGSGPASSPPVVSSPPKGLDKVLQLTASGLSYGGSQLDRGATSYDIWSAYARTGPPTARATGPQGYGTGEYWARQARTSDAIASGLREQPGRIAKLSKGLGLLGAGVTVWDEMSRETETPISQDERKVNAGAVVAGGAVGGLGVAFAAGGVAACVASVVCIPVAGLGGSLVGGALVGGLVHGNEGWWDDNVGERIKSDVALPSTGAW